MAPDMPSSMRLRVNWRRAAAILVVLALLGLSAGLFVHYFYPSRGDEPVYVTIEEGENTAQIAGKLSDAEVVTSALLFRFLAWIEGKQGDFKPGRYELHTGMRYGEVFALLEQGPNSQVRLTLPEGLTLRQTAERVAQATQIPVEDFEAAAKGDFDLGYIPEDRKGNLEGFLFPKTYELAAEVTAREVVQTLLHQFETEVSGLDWSRAEALGLRPYEVVVVASLVEREVVLDDERPLVAAVVYNRLKRDMPLQIDATVQYALPQWKDVLTYEDLKTPSPYNTYLHKGLPPGPICNPGLASIKAALEPAAVDYLYYVATGDGGHFFTADYNEFLRVKEEVQR